MFRRKVFNTVVSLSFSRWNRTGAAVFRSIGRVVRIAVLPIVYSLISVGQHALAQVDGAYSLYVEHIDSVLVEQVRVKSAFAQRRDAVRIISGSDLQLPSLISLHDVLLHVAGLDVRQRGAHGIQADLSIRGGGFDQVLILLNGVDFTDAQTGHHNLNIPIRPEAIERIEVLTGPGARLYGPGAYSGAINIVTKCAKKSAVHLAAQGGQHGLYDSFLGAGHRYDPFSLNAYVSGATSEGYVQNTDYLKYDALITGAAQLPVGRVDLQLGHQTKAFGANAFYTPKFPNQFETIRATLASLSYSGRLRQWGWQASVAYRNHKDRFELFRDNAPDWYKSHNHHLTQLYQARLLGSFTAKSFTTNLAAIARHDEILSTNLGLPLSRPRSIQGVADAQYTHFARRTNLTLSLEETFTLGGLTATLGGMASRNSHFGWAGGYGLDVGYKFTSGPRLYLAVNSAYRLPTFTDNYYTSAAQQGNPYLKPEEALSFEFGCNYGVDLLHLTASLYYRMGRNVIDWLQDPANTSRWLAANHARIDAYGGELTAEYSPLLNGLRSLHFAYGYNMVTSPHGSPAGGSYTFDNLRHHATLRIVSPLWRVVTLVGVLRYGARAGHYIAFETGEPTAYPHSFTVNLRAEKEWRHFSLFAEVNNLLDERLMDLGNVPLPGRWFSGGIAYRFGD